MGLKTIRKFCMLGLPLLLLSASLLKFCFPEFAWGSAIYTISLTANIGYFTNYIAIKMLFKPHFKTAFGRQGLIPKNQDKLADSLSQTLIDNFLSKQQWRKYLIESDLVNTVLAEARIGSQNWLADPKNIQLVENWISDYLTQNNQQINAAIGAIQNQLIDDFVSELEPQELLSQGFEWLEHQFEKDPAKMQMMIEPIIKTIAENIPDIARGLSTALDAHIEEQDTIKRGIAKMAKWSADFDSDDIKRYLFRLVASFEFRETLFNGLKTLISEYKNKPIADSSQLASTSDQLVSQDLQQIFKQLLTGQLAKIDWGQTIQSQLIDSGKCQAIFNQLHAVIFDKVETELNDGPLHSWIIEELVSMIEKLDLRQMVKQKASAFSPQKMEDIFQNMISEQLVFIELLGALLGALSGLALVDIRVFAGLAALLSSYYLADLWLTSRQAENRQSSSSSA